MHTSVDVTSVQVQGTVEILAINTDVKYGNEIFDLHKHQPAPCHDAPINLAGLSAHIA